MKKIILFIILITISSVTLAQKNEIGIFVGGSNYIGDIGRTDYIYPNEFAGGLIYKYNINSRIALRGNYTYIPVSGDDTNSDNVFRQLQGRNFKNTLHEFAIGVEVSFFDYKISNYKTRYTPYIFTQAAFFNHKNPVKVIADNSIQLENKISYSIPFGIGIKGLFFDDLAIAFEIGARYAFTDALDYSTPKINGLDFGGNGNDLYTFAGLSIVYTFGKPQCYGGLTQ